MTSPLRWNAHFPAILWSESKFQVLAFWSQDIMTKFTSQALHIIRIKSWKANGSDPPLSFIPAFWNIGNLLHKQATRVHVFPFLLILTTQFFPNSLAMNIVLMVWLFIKDQLHDVISNEENLLNRIKSLESVDFEKEQKAMKVVFLVLLAL